MSPRRLRLIRQRAGRDCGQPEEHILTIVVSVFFFFFSTFPANLPPLNYFLCNFSGSCLLVVLVLDRGAKLPKIWSLNSFMKASRGIRFHLVLTHWEGQGGFSRIQESLT